MPVRVRRIPGGARGLKRGAQRFVGAVQYALRRQRKAAGAASLWIVIGMSQHHLVHV